MKNTIIKEIYEIIIPKSYIGVHGITKSSDVVESGKKILINGLDNYYRGGLNSNCTIFGQLGNFEFEKVLNYSYYKDKNNFYGNIIIAIPNTMYDIYDNEYFIGPFEDYYLSNNDDRIKKACQHPFNAWINSKQKLKSEFILGCYIKNQKNNINYFMLNENYIGLKSESEKKVFFESIKDELIHHGLKNLNENYIFLNKKSFYGENLIRYLEKEDKKEIIKKII